MIQSNSGVFMQCVQWGCTFIFLLYPKMCLLRIFSLRIRDQTAAAGICGYAAEGDCLGIQALCGVYCQDHLFGGGTPSVLEAGDIARILDCLRAHYRIDADAEITLEMNPGTAAWDKLVNFKQAGINRFSIGLQSADNTELKMLGRIHTYEAFYGRIIRQERLVLRILILI